MSSLKSSSERVGKIVDQVTGFKSGHKKTWRNVVTDTIEQSEFTKFKLTNNILVNVQTSEVEWFEVHPKKEV